MSYFHASLNTFTLRRQRLAAVALRGGRLQIVLPLKFTSHKPEVGEDCIEHVTAVALWCAFPERTTSHCCGSRYRCVSSGKSGFLGHLGAADIPIRRPPQRVANSACKVWWMVGGGVVSALVGIPMAIIIGLIQPKTNLTISLDSTLSASESAPLPAGGKRL
jgi:hypothetical protein